MSSENDLRYHQIRRTCSLASVLDVGCGSGQLVYKLLENGSNAYGVDLVHSNARLAAGWAPTRFVQAEAGRLPFPDAAFDTIVAAHLLDLVPAEALPAVIRELHRVCRRFLFAVVSPVTTREAWDQTILEHGFRRHPLLQTVVRFPSSIAGPNLVLIYEKLPTTTQEQLPFSDIMRAPGARPDAHMPRYQFATGYVRSGDVVLDVARGSGYGTAMLADGSLASRMIGIDVSGHAIDYASTIFAATRKQLEFRCRDGLDLQQYISSRFRSPELLLDVAREVQAASSGESADMGAALCIEGYQLIRHTNTPLPEIDTFLAKAGIYLKMVPTSPHVFGWQISLQFLIGKTQLLVGRRTEAKATFQLLSQQDVLPFSPLLGTKTINAAFYAGWLCALDGEAGAARNAWHRGVTETNRLLKGDWRDVWGDASNPLPFAIAEVANIAEAGSHCAIALKHADRLHRQPGEFWRVMEEHSKSLQAEADRSRAFEQALRNEQYRQARCKLPTAAEIEFGVDRFGSGVQHPWVPPSGTAAVWMWDQSQGLHRQRSG